ncbi:hypothetical protein V7157_19435 [Neobacillus drentensis]|uniref:hypothetical protein n=1 Tax=Neobacillus drentensis TaxID=220684 RepID=UPI003003440C
MSNLNYKEALKEIQSHLNNDLSVEERMELVNKLLDKGVKVEFDYNVFEFVLDEYQEINIESIFEYIDSPVFRKQNGDKRKAHPRYEETYLAKGLNNISDYVLDEWQEWEGRNKELDDYEVLSKYEVERGRKDRENKRVIGFNVDVIDDFLENGLSDTVKQGLEVHVDKVDDYLSKSQKSFKLSENEKRQQRKQEVLDNLQNYPDLKVSYDSWKQLGLKYGFDMEIYTKEEREMYKRSWIVEFENEYHPISPKKRFYELRKHYNEMGYALHVLLQQIQKKIKVNKSKQLTPWVDVDNEIYDLFDLETPEHVAALLKIDYDKKDKEYFPLYYLLHNDYKDKSDSGLYYIFEEFQEALKLTDLNDMEKDIVNLIKDTHDGYCIYNQACTTNPYNLIMKYINGQYGLNKTKANIIQYIENKIARLIADTYYNLKIGTHSLKCTKCEKEKLATLNNFGIDKRNKTGFKSTCRKCLAVTERNKMINK